MLPRHVTISQMLKHSDMHKHSVWEICLNISGSGTNYFEQEETDFSSGSIYVCPPSCLHGKTAETGTFQDISITVSDFGVLGRLKNRYFTDNADNCIKTLMLMLYDVYHTRPSGYQAAAASITESICNMLVVFDGNTEFSPIVELMRNEIIKNFINPEFKIETAIKCTNYNIDYMRKCFKKEIGMTPVAYLNRLRIENAKKLLQQDRFPGYTIGEIANISGFYDACYFSRVFKKMTGVSPREIYKTQDDNSEVLSKCRK